MPDEELARRDGDEGDAWRRWGPYLSERAWGTVREDYSADGDAWSFFPHDHARSRAYRWNEDGLGGICDADQHLCLAFAFWNGRDPILKERIFGLTGSEGNHGEDAKEYWWYLDSTPTHSWMRWRYVYPQAAFPYEELLRENRTPRPRRAGVRAARHRRLRRGPLLGHRAPTTPRPAPDDLCIRLTAPQRRARARRRSTCCRRCGSATAGRGTAHARRPLIGEQDGAPGGRPTPRIGTMTLAGDGAPEALFCDNETNARRLWDAEGPPYPKDGINDHVVDGAATVNPARTGHQGRAAGTGSRSGPGRRPRSACASRRTRATSTESWTRTAGRPPRRGRRLLRRRSPPGPRRTRRS